MEVPHHLEISLGENFQKESNIHHQTPKGKSSTQKCHMIGNMLLPSEAICLFIFFGREGVVPDMNHNKLHSCGSLSASRWAFVKVVSSTAMTFANKSLDAVTCNVIGQCPGESGAND